jgi:crossover junction endodeoxyribonuclease RusA
MNRKTRCFIVLSSVSDLGQQTLNATGNHWERARLVKEWRTAFHLLAKEAKIPPMKWMAVTAEPFTTEAEGRQQDVAACNPAVKAAIDGIVDAGVLPDDSPQST